MLITLLDNVTPAWLIPAQERWMYKAYMLQHTCKEPRFHVHRNDIRQFVQRTAVAMACYCTPFQRLTI